MSRTRNHLLLLATTLWSAQFVTYAWIVPQPKANVWRTLAEALGQDHICLDTGAAKDPMSSCLVGIPLPPSELPPLFNYAFSLSTTRDAIATFWSAWRDGVRGLIPLDSEPQELHLLGSAVAPVCIQFRFTPRPGEKGYTVLNPSDPRYQATRWCKRPIKVPLSSTPGGKPLALPRGIFFICGDRAWAGIPSHHIGGPCAFGRLSLLTPNITQIYDWRNKSHSLNSTSDSARVKRDLKDLDPDCDSVIEHWAKPKIVALTIFLPWVSIAKSLGELARLECWVEKQANFTSAALSDLLYDEKMTRQATLQNRAAIDFLLLLHNHRCEEFEGLCCMNLSSRAEDARVAIDKMHGLISNIKQQTADWLGDLFSGWGLSGWVASVLKSVVYVCFTLIVILISGAILWGCVQRLIFKLAHSPEVLHLQSTNFPEENSWEDTSFRSDANSDPEDPDASGEIDPEAVSLRD
ncbi:uncharacterized protein [Molothrus aeneus]|uniref:uncharacterized protein n=1 Tax=Molothrus aeneus TaxID=84833 RepID=UPI00345ACC84